MSDLLTSSPFDPARERRLVLLADSLPPDFGAVGQYALLRAEALASRGHHVDLFGLTSAAASITRGACGEGTLTVTRIAARAVPRASLAARLAWTLWADVRLVLAAWSRLRAADGILFTGSPPFLIHFLAPLKLLLKGRLVYRITDFHPECLIAARERPSRALELLRRLTSYWRRRIDSFEVLGYDQWRRLSEQGVADERISLVRDGSPITRYEKPEPIALPPALQGKTVLLYSGNFGVAHDWLTVAEGYERHHRAGSARVHLWLNAIGAGAEQLAAHLAARRVPFLHSKPVPLAQLPAVLRAADAHLITLKDAFVGLVMPSKVYALLDMGATVVFVGSPQSDVDLLAREARLTYWRVSCGDAEQFARVMEDLAEAGGNRQLYT